MEFTPVRIPLARTQVYSKIVMTLDRGPTTGRLRVCIECFESLNLCPVRIEQCLVHKLPGRVADTHDLRNPVMARALLLAGVDRAVVHEFITDLDSVGAALTPTIFREVAHG